MAVPKLWLGSAGNLDPASCKPELTLTITLFTTITTQTLTRP